MDNTLQALVEPRRRDILGLVREREMAASEIAAHFPEITRPAVSQHLKVLMEAGLITLRREGTRRLYRTRPEGLAELRQYLDGFWAFSLQQLKRAAEAEERRSGNFGG